MMEMKMGVTTMENSMKVPPKLRIELPYEPAIPLLGIYPKKAKTVIRKNICSPKVAHSIIYNNHDIETTYMPIRLPRWH